MAIQLREHKRECWVEDRFDARECWPHQYEHPEDCDVCGGCGEVSCTDPLCDCRVTCERCGSMDVSWSPNGDGPRVVCGECGCVFDADGLAFKRATEFAAAPDLLAALTRAVSGEECLRDGMRGDVPQDRDCADYDDERAGPSAWCWVCHARAALAKAQVQP